MFTHRGTSPSTGMWQGEVFAISDGLVVIVCAAPFTFAECAASESSSMALTITPAGHEHAWLTSARYVQNGTH